MKHLRRIFVAAAGLFFLSASFTGFATEERYCRFEYGPGSAYGRVVEDRILVLDAAPWDGGEETGRSVSLATATLLAPSEPRNIIGLAGAYASPESNPPRTVRWFAKSASAAAADGEDVPLPAALDALKVEVEMVIVIGETVKNADKETAAEAIFGYTTGTEIMGFVESYHRANGEDPSRVEPLLGLGLKLGDRFAPCGPFIHRGVDWRGRARTLTVKGSDGEVKANYAHSTTDLLHPPARIVSDLSRVVTLEPGDLVFTGTTEAFTATAGDTVVTEVEGLGKLTNRIVPRVP